MLRKYVPFSVLDAVSRMQVEQEFASVIDRMRSTTVVVTHNANEGVVFPDRTVVVATTAGHVAYLVSVPVPRPSARSEMFGDSELAVIRCRVLTRTADGLLVVPRIREASRCIESDAVLGVRCERAQDWRRQGSN